MARRGALVLGREECQLEARRLDPHVAVAPGRDDRATQSLRADRYQCLGGRRGIVDLEGDADRSGGPPADLYERFLGWTGTGAR